MPRTENLKRIGNMEKRKGRRLIWCWRKNEVGGLQCRWETAKKYFKGLTEKGKNSALKTHWDLDKRKGVGSWIVKVFFVK